MLLPSKDAFPIHRSKVAVLLVNYKDYAKRYLAPCYKSLLSQDYPRDLFEIFITDNSSTEESRASIRQIAPEARILSNTENLGWAGGNNTAIREALEIDFDYIVLLNMDTVTEKDWLIRLVEKADQRKDLHILQSKILLHGTRKINSLGNRIQFLGYGYCNGYGQEEPLPSRLPVDFASGAAMLVKREVFEKIGLFREEYFMYGDDLEFCWRARLAGYEVGLAEDSVCHHKYDFRKVVNSIGYLERNRLLTVLTLEKWQTLLMTLPALVLFQIGVLVYFTLRGKATEMAKTALYFLKPKTWKRIRKIRTEIGQLRVRKDSEVVRAFAGRIVFSEIRSVSFYLFVNPLLWAYWNVVRLFIIW